MLRPAVRLAEIGLSLALAVAVHAAVFLGYDGGAAAPGGAGGTLSAATAPAVGAADPALEALVAAWETAPAHGEAPAPPGSPPQAPGPDVAATLASDAPELHLALSVPDRAMPPAQPAAAPDAPERRAPPSAGRLRAMALPEPAMPALGDIAANEPAALPQPARMWTREARRLAALAPPDADTHPAAARASLPRADRGDAPERAPLPAMRPSERRSASRATPADRAAPRATRAAPAPTDETIPPPRAQPAAPASPAQSGGAPARSAHAPAGGPGPSHEASGGSGGADRAALERSFGALVRDAIARQKRYPRRAHQRGQEGVARLSVTLDRSGSLLAARISRSSGTQALDDAALAAARAVPRYPTPPATLVGERFSFVVPIAFRLVR